MAIYQRDVMEFSKACSLEKNDLFLCVVIVLIYGTIYKTCKSKIFQFTDRIKKGGETNLTNRFV